MVRTSSCARLVAGSNLHAVPKLLVAVWGLRIDSFLCSAEGLPSFFNPQGPFFYAWDLRVLQPCMAEHVPYSVRYRHLGCCVCASAVRCSFGLQALAGHRRAHVCVLFVVQSVRVDVPGPRLSRVVGGVGLCGVWGLCACYACRPGASVAGGHRRGERGVGVTL